MLPSKFWQIQGHGPARDTDTGSEAGANATPSFFINGEFLNGAQPKADFVAIIDRQLAAATGKNSVLASR